MSPAGPHAGWQGRFDGLDLRGEQRAAIQAIVERYRTKAWELSRKSASVRERFAATAPDDPAYAEVTAEAAEAASAMAADAVRLFSEMRSEIHAVLDPAQQQILREQADQKSKRWDEWRERHRTVPR